MSLFFFSQGLNFTYREWNGKKVSGKFISKQLVGDGDNIEVTFEKNNKTLYVLVNWLSIESASIGDTLIKRNGEMLINISV
jgi:hypothetical protein